MPHDPSDYVQKVRDDTRRYIQDLLTENGRLRRLLEAEADDPQPFREETLKLEEEVRVLRQEVQQHRLEKQQLSEQLRLIEEENHRFSSKYVEVEEQNNNLANLYVASYRLHETLDRHSVLEAMLEIIINLIGSEEFAIFERPPGGSEVELAAAFGIENEELEGIDATRGEIARTLETGNLFVAPADGPPSELVACVPLRLGSETVGAIAVLSLLEHKESLEPVDHELFDLLSAHAATALHLSSLHALPEPASQPEVSG